MAASPAFVEPLLTVPVEVSNKRRFLTIKQVILVMSFTSVVALFVIFPLPIPNRSNATDLVSLNRSNVCQIKDYAEDVLKLTYEMSCLGWVSKRDRKFEASGVIYANDAFYVVSDNTWKLLQFDTFMHPFNQKNKLIRPRQQEEEDSSFEGLFLDKQDNVFYVVREAVPKDKTFVAEIIEIKVDQDFYDIKERCKCEMEFSHENKGFEGLIVLRDIQGVVYLLGLCEGNYCTGGAKGREKGNGRIVVMKKITEDNKCLWKTVKILNLPEELHFEDYSAMAVYGNSLAITSQQDSMVWIGEIQLNSAYLINDLADLKVLDGGRLFLFPRDNDCNVIYCNIEGINFINNRMLVAVSDEAKHGRQDYRCLQKDQSLHVFAIPATADTAADAVFNATTSKT